MDQSHVLGMVCGYYLSRETDAYEDLGMGNQRQTHQALGKALGVPARSIQNWRDEFDPVHDTPRKGWRNREMAPSRRRLIELLGSYDPSELYALVNDAIKSPLGPLAQSFLAVAWDVDSHR